MSLKKMLGSANVCTTLLVLVASFPGGAVATGFLCTVREAHQLTDQGGLRRDSWYESELSKRPFSVNRERGVVTGMPMDNAWATDIHVLSHGGDASAFKVLSIRAKDDPHYLRIDVFQRGIEKPFVGHTGSSVFVGTCRRM